MNGTKLLPANLTALAEEIAANMKGVRPVDGRMVSERQYDLPRLQALHNEILRLKLTGMKNVDIAERLNCTAVVVSYTINSSLGKSKLAMMHSMRDEGAVNFDLEIREMIPDALDIYKGILSGELTSDIRIRKATADTVVKDLAGKAAPTRIQGTHTHMHLTPEAIENMKLRGMKAAVAAGVVIPNEE